MLSHAGMAMNIQEDHENPNTKLKGGFQSSNRWRLPWFQPVETGGIWDIVCFFKAGRRDPGPEPMQGSDPNPMEGSGPEPIPVLKDQSGVVHGASGQAENTVTHVTPLWEG